MTSPAWHYRDQLQAQDSYPDNLAPEAGQPPTEITVNVLVPVTWFDADLDAMREDRAREWRSFPMFMTKAALRFKAYCERKYGTESTWVDYD
jgi:hypothetical protein